MNEFTNKILHANALNLLARLPDESVGAVIADPMYGTVCEYEWGWDPAAGDPELHWEYHRPIYDECRRVLKPGGALAWSQAVKLRRHFPEWFGDHRIWALTRYGATGRFATGNIWIVQTREQTPIRMPDRDPLVICDSLGAMRKLHPYTKTVEEMSFLVEALTEPSGIILDWCCGLGATLLAAETLGRRWIGCDLGKTYCQIAQLRMDNLRTHRKAGRRSAARNGSPPLLITAAPAEESR